MIYLTLIASVLIGFGFGILLKPKTKLLQLFLSFSGAYLLSVTVLHLLPEVFETQKKHIGLFILLGIILQTVLEFFSKGAEHGHIHKHDFDKKIPWLILISLSIHAFFEGIPLGLDADRDLLWAIVIHKIPITIVLVVFLQNSSLPKTLIYTFILLFALVSPLGMFLGNKILIFNQYEAPINAIIIGIFLHISSAILFESSENHQFNIKKFIAIILGFLVAFISL